MRAQVIRIKQREYVDAAKIMGASKLQIYLKDILPNSFSPVMVQATLDMGNIVLVGATLSFIGLSEAGIAEWGVLVSEGQAGISAGRWWASTFPGLMVFLWALAFNLVGDGLRDVLDPRTEIKEVIMSPDNLDIQNSLDKDLIASVTDLKVYFESKQGMVHSVDGVSLTSLMAK